MSPISSDPTSKHLLKIIKISHIPLNISSSSDLLKQLQSLENNLKLIKLWKISNAKAKKKNMCVYGHPTYPNFS